MFKKKGMKKIAYFVSNLNSKYVHLIIKEVKILHKNIQLLILKAENSRASPQKPQNLKEKNK